jgi:hypothetical protein
MSAPIFAGMAGFADNFTKAYSGEKRRQSDEEERKAEREWRNEQRGRQRQEWQEADKLKTDLKDAGAVRTEQQGTMTEGQAGGVMQRTFNQNPEEAQRVKAMMDAEADMTGAAPATQQQTAAVTGNMARGHQIGQTMGAMGADPNSSEAVAQRTAQAYRKAGQVDKAILMENAVLDQQAKRLGLSIDQLKFADLQTNRAMDSALRSAPTWYEGATKFVSDAQRSGLKDVKAEHELSPDGKSVTLFAVMPDGKRQATGTYPADESGMLQFMQKFATLPIEKRMDMMIDQLKRDQTQSNWQKTFDANRGDATQAQANWQQTFDANRDDANRTQSNWQQTFDFNKKKDENEQQYRNRLLGFQAAQDARAAQTHKVAMEDAKIPAAVKTLAASYQEQIKSASAALNKAMAEGSFNPESPGTKQLIMDQKEAMQNLADTLAPYSKKAEGGATTAAPLGQPPTSATANKTSQAPAQTGAPAAQKPVVSMSQAMPAAPKPPPTVLEALNPGGNASLNATMQPMAQAIESLAAQLKQAQATLAQAAKGDPQAAIAQAQRVQAIRDAINKQLEGMNPPQAAQVTRAAGL